MVSDRFEISKPVSTRIPARVAIAGAGLIGLFCAWSLARRGVEVVVIDRSQPGQGASRAAAGMLAPAYEAAGEEDAHPRLLELCLEAARAWPDIARQLETDSGIGVDYRPGPTLAVAGDISQLHHLGRISAGCRSARLPFEILDPVAAHAIEPSLKEGIAGALLLPSDAQVDNRRTLEALMRALARRDVTFHIGMSVDDVETGTNGVRLPDGSHADVLIDATGWRAAAMMPVKGVAIALAKRPGLPGKVVRFGTHYLVPKRDRIVLGATVQPGESDNDVNGSAVAGLIAAAERICPAICDAEIIDRWAGVRPRSRDLAPLIGWRRPGHYVAGGHYRNGVLLAPLTGELVASHLLTGTQSALAAAFDPLRPGVTPD